MSQMLTYVNRYELELKIVESNLTTTKEEEAGTMAVEPVG